MYSASYIWLMKSVNTVLKYRMPLFIWGVEGCSFKYIQHACAISATETKDNELLISLMANVISSSLLVPYEFSFTILINASIWGASSTYFVLTEHSQFGQRFVFFGRHSWSHFVHTE